MFTRTQIMEMMHTSENSGIEFQEVRMNNGKLIAPHRDSLSDELAAFANQLGGTVIFGVANDPKQDCWH